MTAQYEEGNNSDSNAGSDDNASSANDYGNGAHSEASQSGPPLGAPNDRRRFFSRAERFVLQALAGGRCEQCGTSLDAGYHADHRVPHSAGGPTDVSNGMALCPDCNIRKGDRTEIGAADIGAPVRTTMEEGTMETIATEPEAHDNTVGPEAHDNTILPAESEDERGGWPEAGPNPQPEAGPDPQTVPRPSSQSAPPASLRQDGDLRAWQQDGIDCWRRIRDAGGRDMTVAAVPGSGKTRLALALAGLEIDRGRADLLVIVVPTRAIKAQWAQAAHRAGLALTADWGNSAVAPPADTDGCVVTYQQVAALPAALRLLCARRRVLAVLDEVHHCATSRAWGDGVHQALEHAAARLCLSGTAWRTDGAPIPFVPHDERGVCLPDLSYGYPRALAEGVLRECYFFALGARVSWLDERGERQATFDDTLGEQDRSRRLRAALDPEGGWLPDMLGRADAALAQARASGHTGAKALALAMGVGHARAVAAILTRLTGETPAVALADDPESLSTLARFRTGRGRWLVAVRMVAEGWDCPDVRVLAWATHVTGEMAFRQAVARALRTVPGLTRQEALVFLPADGRLIALARGLADGRTPVPSDGEGLDQEAGDGEEREGEQAVAGGLFVPLSSRATGQSVVTGGAIVPASALRRARELNAAQAGPPALPDHALAAALARREAARREAARTEEAQGRRPPAQELWTGGVPAEDRPAVPPGGAVGDTSQGIDGNPRQPRDSGSSRDHGSANGDERGLDDEAGQEADWTYDEQNRTYDERRRELRRICTRLTALIARELDVNPSVVYRAFHRSLESRQAESTLAGLEERKRLLEGKLRELRAP